jgi:hypothetical protein
MPYLVLKSCFAGGVRRSAGDVIDLAASEASALKSIGRVSEVEKKIEPKTDRSVGLAKSSTPKPKTRAKAKK